MITEYKCGCIVVSETVFKSIPTDRYKVPIPIGENLKITYLCRKHKNRSKTGRDLNIKEPWNAWDGIPHPSCDEKGFQFLVEGVPKGRSIW